MAEASGVLLRFLIALAPMLVACAGSGRSLSIDELDGESRRRLERTLPSVRRSVVRILIQSGFSEVHGTGFALESGEILTAFHVIDAAVDLRGRLNMERVRIEFEDGRPAGEAELVGALPHRDLALLRLAGASGRPVRFSAPSGDRMFTIGFGSGRLEVTAGMIEWLDFSGFVSAPGYFVERGLIGSVPVVSGDSGSPVFDLDGRLIGVVIAGVEGSSCIAARWDEDVYRGLHRGVAEEYDAEDLLRQFETVAAYLGRSRPAYDPEALDAIRRELWESLRGRDALTVEEWRDRWRDLHRKLQSLRPGE
jgi:S1-C subfamily serine protease